MAQCEQMSQGTKFYYDLDGTPPYTELADVKSISGPEITVEIKERPKLALTDGYKEYCAGFKDGGEISLTLYFTKAQYALVKDTLFAELYYYKVEFPLVDSETTNSILVARGILRKVGLEIPEDDFITVPVAIKVTGKPTFTAGS
jgi:hypothetical protein